ncbi:MAG: putative thiol:disulfide interchange protein DsbC precursor [Candidatus Accumulibacter regalis]|jgi:thiol:disulfide interchange protein DsbC|uniref:Thiol:disulfide interchange protein n=1 Tax=Accumulibacter regalis TaxID=522306 RepID=A0A011R1Z5_ACCRE|nr:MULTISPECIES: DsbC family protein [unclassified Candidatus Accumulibacter]EXI85219.1 MAG: putative thiol:disulfide interchange protein DsbC precursor [Candidatus Accumulibacter regalis]MQM33689.1 thiol:disulfide interchange protein [Candidatus Accumulibacter phosphatis]MBL8367435.1 DsbC family protein [Accumulibacter sp.]HRE72782.1 DsbC family protein [Accumulibacter sp.]HRE85441.1 DsbC family protein [Accumulibacter sp.]
MSMKLVSFAVAAALSLPTLADEASVKKALEGKLGAPVTSVTKTPYLGLYEVYADGQIVYTDEKVSALLVGSLIDGKTMKNVTTERMQKLTAIKFSDLPLSLAIKQVRGDGKRVFATFEDPNCGYCKKLAREITKLENVTIYTFLYPILSPDSLEKSNQIWCSADKAKAWNDWMIDGKAPGGKGDCDTTAVKKSVETGRKLAINGTPTVFFADGERIPGAIPLARIEQKLAEVASSAR